MQPSTQHRIWAGVLTVGAISAALSIIPQLDGARQWLVDAWESRGAIELPGAYPGEIWRRAGSDEVAWLQDDWCYPSLRGFIARFQLRDGSLLRQNEAGIPSPFKTEWVEAEAFISNRNQLRLRYKSSDWPGDYISFDPDRKAEWQENQRYTEDNGTVVSGDKRLVISCNRCSVSSDGITYDCP